MMSTSYELKFSQQNFSYKNKVEIYGTKSGENIESQFFAFLDEKLYNYKYDNHNNWQANLLLNDTFKNQVLYFPKILKDNESIMMLKTEIGIDFYQYKNSRFELLLRSNDFDSDLFHDVYGWNKRENVIKCGHFYNDKSFVGILSKHKNRGLKFDAVMNNELQNNKYPIWPLDCDLEILGDISEANFFLGDLKRSGQENIVVLNTNGLNVYEFNHENDLQLLYQIPESGRNSESEEKIFFPNLTAQPLKDIVLFNSSGLFIYQYSVKRENYRIIHYNPLFSKESGWNVQCIDTIHFRDINLDGKQEMFLTGPQGMDILSFNNYTLDWNSVLDVPKTDIANRHNYIVQVGSTRLENKDYPIVFTRDQKKLYWANIETEENLFDDDSESNSLNESSSNVTLQEIPEIIIPKMMDEEKPHILLRDQLDSSSVIRALDKNTGKASFKLPLIHLPNFSREENMNLYYNGNKKDSSTLGIGWSFPFGLISMDHQGSIFPENERYFLLLEDFPQPLILDSENSTDSIYNFKLSNQNSTTKVQYLKNEERWEIDYRDIKQIYGRRQGSNDESINWDLSWEYWRGVGSSTSGQVELATAWFLTEIRSGENSAMYYTYDINNFPVPNSDKQFTREVYLKTIHDNEGNKIIFKYSNKTSDEFNLPPLIDKNGNYNPTKVQTRYLTGYSVTTPRYRQDINFIYEVENGKRFLTEIGQVNDPTNRPVLQFYYKEILNTHQLEKVILPAGTSVEFSYETMIGPSYEIDKINLICDVSNSYKIDYGPDFVLISYLNKYNHVVLRMFNRELTTEMYSSLSTTESSRFPFFGKSTVHYYEIKMIDESLALILDYGNDKDVCLLHKEKNKWPVDPKYYNVNKDAIIQIGNDFIVILDTRKFLIEVIVWDKKSEKWSVKNIENSSIKNATDLLLRVSGKIFFIYNDDVVIVGYRNKINEWQTKDIIKLPGVISGIKNTLKKFDLEKGVYDELIKNLKNNVFQTSNNFILFNTWNLEGTKMYSEIKLFSLNSAYEVIHEKNHKVTQDDLSEISKEIEVEDNEKKKSFLTLSYKKDGKKFKIILKSFRGAIEEEVRKSCNNEKCRSEYVKKIKEQVMKAFQKTFILNLQKYLAQLSPSMAMCSNTKFIFDGNNWKVDMVTEKESKLEQWSLSIGDKFALVKDNLQSSIKLYNWDKNEDSKGSLILDLGIKHINQILNKYPTYLVYQTENEELNIVFYEYLDFDKKNKKFTLPEGEILSLMSDYYTLVTHSESTVDNQTVTLNLRQLFDIKTSLPNPVIKKLTVNFDDGYKRVTGFDYDRSSVKAVGDILYYKKMFTIPGNNKSNFGFIEESKNFTDAFSAVDKIYDAKGNVIKIIQDENSNKTKKNKTEKNEHLSSLLLDVTDHLEVANFFPYAMQDEEAGYYGFEDYEMNKIGATNKNHWSFNETDVVKQMFSLTGENYLSLSKNRLLGTFAPNNQNQSYIASCWVRSSGKSLEVGGISPYLKAVVYTKDNREVNGYISEVNFQYDEWYYLEVVIDLFFSKQVFTNLVTNSPGINTASIPNSDSSVEIKPFKIIITVGPDKDSVLDVDHIRFSPLNCNFQATTYNFKTKEIKEVINANGLIKRYVYNDYQDQNISVNEDGEIERIISHTKTSSIASIVNLKSKIQIQPNGGFCEDFNPHAFIRRWKINNNQNWKISPGELHHRSEQYDQLKLRNMQTTFDSYGIRLYFSLKSKSSAINFNNVLQLKQVGKNAVIMYSKVERQIPSHGELLLIAEHNRFMVWIDGGLYFDEGDLDQSLFDINVAGDTSIRDTLVFTEPSVQITYFNGLGERVQEINLESANTVIVTEFLFDELGRQSITTTSTRLERPDSQPLVAYYSNFITNKNPFFANSVWKINRIEGEFESLKPHDYYQVTYKDNPLNEESAVGLPSQKFSVEGMFAKHYTSSTDNLFINRHYPPGKDYRYEVEQKIGGIENIKVFNNKNHTVAWMMNVPGKSDLLATYEYNDDDKLIHTLSPLYHKEAGTLQKLNSDFQFFSKENNELQHSLRLDGSYNEKGNLVSKTAPDSGKVEYVYDDAGLLKFSIFYSNFNSTAIENVVYFDYDYLGRLTNTGKLISPPRKEELLELPLTKNNIEEYQVFYRSDFEREPTLRGRLKRSITHNDGIPFIEESWLNGDNNVVSKRIIVLNENLEEPWMISTNKVYKAGKLREIEYPVNVQGKSFKVSYSYDKLGQIKDIGVPTKKNLFVEFTYNSVGQILTEHHLPDKINFNFTRRFTYDSASFMTKLEDKFLTENVHYTEGSYSGRGFGDGTITRTEFKAHWHDLYADSSKLRLNESSFIGGDMTLEESKLCFNKLKEAGYINEHHRQAKIYYPSLEIDFPTVCSIGIHSRRIQSILGKQGFPSTYGHLYDYGPYQELIKAKYFVGDEIPEPLHPDIFSKKIPEVSSETSHDIWEILNNSHFLIAGKAGKSSLIRSKLLKDLKNLDYSYRRYLLPLEKILAYYFSKKLDLPLFKLNLKKAFSKWSSKEGNGEEKELKAANEISKMLEEKGYLKNPLDKKFNELLKKYKLVIPEIVEVLFEYIGKQLTEAEFDVEAYDIDENGNHKLYYSGSKRCQLIYRNDSNQIDKIFFKLFTEHRERSFLIQHDSRGNVIQALHKGIKNITYHSVSNRASSIELLDGRKVIFYYDAQGERVLKRITDADGNVRKEIHYVRDEFGRSLVEREMVWSSSTLPPSVLVTVYIYGPKGMIGFIRRDEYYSVITDHEGSTRLVVKDGEVVAAYDYLPYGNLMRLYGSNPEAHISYRYTGQEWDEETDLYNYHARFYDPSIGRFYQHDPKMQFFSPYKYAGNSPISTIDPDGEFAFLLFFLIVGLGAAGAYLGGAAASGKWNPGKWDFKDPNLYLSMGFGFIGGALLPVGLTASVTAFTALGLSYSASVALTTALGAVGVYAGMAKANNEWNPAKWDLNNPEVWNAAFIGFGTFAGFPGGVHSAANFYMSLSTIYSKGLFIGAGATVSSGLLSLRLAGQNLDFSKPEVYYEILEGIIFAADIPMVLHGGFRFFRKNIKNIKRGVNTIRNVRRGYESLNSLKSVNSLITLSSTKLLGTIVISSLTGALVSGAFSEGGIDFTKGSTYDSFVNGMLLASSLSSSARVVYKKKIHAKKIKVNKEAITIAKESVDMYKQIIKDYEFPKEAYKQDVRMSLETGKIPNRVVAVALTKDGMAFVAYSGKEGPGFLSSFHKKGQSHSPSENNGFIGYDPENPRKPRIIALNDNPEENSLILKVLEDKKKMTIKMNYKEYEEQQQKLESLFVNKIVPSLSSPLQSYFTTDEVSNILREIGTKIKGTGYIDNLDIVTNIISTPILRKKDTFNIFNKIITEFGNIKQNDINKLIKLEKKLVAAEEKIGLSKHDVNRHQAFDEKKEMLNVRLNKIKKTKEDLVNDINLLKKELMKKNVNSDGRSDKGEMHELWEKYIEKYKDRFIHWAPINCAEPHVLTLVSRSLQVFPAHVGATYTTDDIKYLAAYKITHNKEIPVLEPMARCSNCQVTTRKIKNILTDPQWEQMIEMERNKIVSKLGKLNFFMPYYNIIYDQVRNETKSGNNTDSKKKRLSRTARNIRTDHQSTTDNKDDVIPKKYRKKSVYLENDESTNNVGGRSKNMTSNFFSWLGSSINQLFDTKKILPAKPSTPNTLEGISNSNNNLLAVTAAVDGNSTILLLDAVIRKITGQKYAASENNQSASLLDARAYSLDVGLAFEKSIKYAASKSGISMHRFNVHYMDIQEKVIDKIMSGKLDEIAQILISHAEKACPSRETGCPGKLSPKKFEKFINEFSKEINVELNKIMQEYKIINGM